MERQSRDSSLVDASRQYRGPERQYRGPERQDRSVSVQEQLLNRFSDREELEPQFANDENITLSLSTRTSGIYFTRSKVVKDYSLYTVNGILTIHYKVLDLSKSGSTKYDAAKLKANIQKAFSGSGEYKGDFPIDLLTGKSLPKLEFRAYYFENILVKVVLDPVDDGSQLQNDDYMLAIVDSIPKGKKPTKEDPRNPWVDPAGIAKLRGRLALVEAQYMYADTPVHEIGHNMGLEHPKDPYQHETLMGYKGESYSLFNEERANVYYEACRKRVAKKLYPNRNQYGEAAIAALKSFLKETKSSYSSAKLLPKK